VCREVRAVGKARGGLEDVHLQDVARARTGDRDRAGEQVGAGTTVVHAIEDVGDAGVHQQIRRVTGVVGESLDGHQIPRPDGKHRWQPRVEKAPVHRRGSGREAMDRRGHVKIMPA
jgi:hypothetical protein